ncbi:PAS domain-containing protein [Ferruginivarius sediminum]|uniref:histidine kinase n=2 Tax=Ferruginivarius sediminum TaxID=2661937 RepID=A0A369TE34_9PROT|nr:PAS domain-containing protein [Ferruginivarius sediminum]
MRSTALLSAPAVGTLAVLGVAGVMPLIPAIVTAVVTAGGIAALLARHSSEMASLRRFVEMLRTALDRDATLPEPPQVTSPGIDPELAEAIAESARERQVRRRELRAAINSNEAVLSGLPDPLLLIDADGVVTRANPAAGDLFGENIEDRPLATVLRNPELLQAVDKVLAEKGHREVEFTSPGEIERYFSARVAALRETGPKGGVAVVTLHDVTAIRRAEQMRADFVANASHELRTPLSSLLGFIETLQGPAKEDAEARDRFLDIMLEQAKRMSALVEDLLSLSRIELDEHTPPTERADLRKVIDRVVGALELKAREKDMSIEVDTPDRGSLTVVGDEDQLTQVLQNLVDNAIKYGRAGTPIRVVAQPADRSTGRPSRRARRGAAVSVIDQGEGIPREHIPRLTERFYRVDKARSRQLGGTGLGLAIVKHIVNRHRGQLEIDSTPGQETRFTVYLPTGEPESSDQAAE